MLEERDVDDRGDGSDDDAVTSLASRLGAIAARVVVQEQECTRVEPVIAARRWDRPRAVPARSPAARDASRGDYTRCRQRRAPTPPRSAAQRAAVIAQLTTAVERRRLSPRRDKVRLRAGRPSSNAAAIARPRGSERPLRRSRHGCAALARIEIASLQVRGDLERLRPSKALEPNRSTRMAQSSRWLPPSPDPESTNPRARPAPSKRDAAAPPMQSRAVAVRAAWPRPTGPDQDASPKTPTPPACKSTPPRKRLPRPRQLARAREQIPNTLRTELQQSKITPRSRIVPPRADFRMLASEHLGAAGCGGIVVGWR